MDYQVHITMVGAGYVGLISAACFAELGHHVICTDKDTYKIEALQNGDVPIYEPQLNAMIHKNIKQGTLKFSKSLSEAVTKSNIIFIAIGTPPLGNGDMDVSEIEIAIKDLAPLLTDYKIIVIKSTVPVGLSRRLSNMIREINTNAQFSMLANPEFLRAGSGVHDFMHPDRIVVGMEDNAALSFMNFIYQPLIKQGIPIHYTNLENCELIKYVSNCFLATKIAFTNEIADLCEALGTNISEVLYGVGLDKRIGNDYFQPGPGFGGSCLIKDAHSLVNIAKEKKAPLHLIESVLASNRHRKKTMVDKIIAACHHSVQDKRLAILGVSFKANTDDTRESTTLSIILQLQAQGAKLSIYDPKAKTTDLELLFGIKRGKDLIDTLRNTDVIVIMTEWEEFSKLDLKEIKNYFRNTLMEPTIIDLRNLYDPIKVSEAGIRYVSLGRPTVEPIKSKEVEPFTFES